jgi:hypothetical protein
MAGRFPVNAVASIVVEVNAPALLMLAFSTLFIFNLISEEPPSASKVRSSEELFMVDIS